MAQVSTTVIVLLTFLATGNSQFGAFFADYGEECSKIGINIGFPPNVTDYWFITELCKNYNGTVSCITPDDDSTGICECNLGDAAYAYFNKTLKVCLGKVGAYCTSEYSSLVPSKFCTPGAECIATQGEDHTVGRCTCIDGYLADEEGKCIWDESYRPTPRTTTTTVKPSLPPIPLPPINFTLLDYGETCSKYYWNFTMCNPYEKTVTCVNGTCQCSLTLDAKFDENLETCVGLVGASCGEDNEDNGGSSHKVRYCTEGAFCAPLSASEGVCVCLPGYDVTDDKECSNAPSEGNQEDITTEEPSSTVPITDTPPTDEPPSSPSVGTTSKPPGDDGKCNCNCDCNCNFNIYPPGSGGK